jgi:hypothetical protein
MAVHDEKGRLCGVRHPASLVRASDAASDDRRPFMTDTPPAEENGLVWAARRGMGALAEKMGMQFVEFTVDVRSPRCPSRGTPSRSV